MADFGHSSSSRRKILQPCKDRRRSRLHRCCDRRDWSGLPRNVLFNIMDRLTVIDDYVRFGAVCRPWRTIFLEEIPESINKHCSQPFLLVPSTKTKTSTIAVLYSLSTKRVYQNFRFRFPINKYFLGSSFGWLVSLERQSRFNFQVQLQNPFLSKDYIIHLPPPDDLETQHVDIDGVGGWAGHYIFKSVLSCDPSLSRDFIVMAIMSRYRGLAFCKYGDTAWTSIGNWIQEWDQKIMFHDVIFSHKAKQFYALRLNGQVVAIDFGNQGPKILQVMPPVTIFDRTIKAYLVEDLSGDLLLVSKNVKNLPEEEGWYVLTVHKLDLVQGKWIKIRNLGNSVLFLGMNGSIARSLSDCPGCQPNCIYFTEDICSIAPNYQFYDPPGSGVYSLDDDTIRSHYNPIGPNIKPRILPAPIWLEPTLFPSMYGV